MRRVKKTLSISPEILKEACEAAKACCGGNFSEYFRRLHNGNHAANKIKMSELQRAIKTVIREEFNRNER